MNEHGTPNTEEPDPRKTPPQTRTDAPHITLTGSGQRLSDPIVVRGARSEMEGVFAEFTWLIQKFGQKDVDWRLRSQSHGKHEGRDIDTFHIVVGDGTAATVFFDCTDFFGKSPY